MPKSHAGRHQQGSRRAWAVRGVLGVVALGLAFVSLTGTLANVVVKADARAAHTLAAGDGRNVAAFAAQSFSAGPESDPFSAQAQLATAALQADATVVEALNVLGLQAQLRQDETRADQLFAYSFALSRRELQPQIWAIEKAVERGDIDLALANYDIALRTSSSARGALFPVLASALSEPAIRARLISMLPFAPTWGRAFIQYAVANTPDPQDAVRLLQSERAEGLPVDDAVRARLVQRLVAHNLPNEAWAYYSTFRPGVDRQQSRDQNFVLQDDVRTPFDWNVAATTGLSAAILPGEDGGILDFALPPSTGATIARQTQMLPPGTYVLRGRSSGIDLPASSRPYWSLACRGGSEQGRVDVPNSAERSGEFSGEFVVPPDCEVQTLALVARSSDRITGISGQIESAVLEPLQ